MEILGIDFCENMDLNLTSLRNVERYDKVYVLDTLSRATIEETDKES